MILQIRGTSGSGKSTAMRWIMNHLGDWNGTFVPGRKQPLYYVHEEFPIIVLGHYESPCGGCDTIGSARAVYDLIQATQPTDLVLCEGLLLSEDVKWTSQMKEVRCIFLSTSLEECLKNVQKRRMEAGNEKPLNPSNTSNRVVTIERAKRRLEEAGVWCCYLSFEQTVDEVVEWVRKQYTSSGVAS